ncbi:bone morphogenetic protein 7 [Tetranychus urticae]|uniref:TGF-beta family profile domain-containing protein n=1 Tax=Tetranychus urticae TaxID=32264 RepID=T1KPY1_TETUR|nr:bone morphogenetic protein 7 [Tetranychus urticae]
MKFTIKSFIGVFNLIEVLFALQLSGASYDQSIAYKLLPAAEKRQLQYQMLNLFGLDHRPKPKRKDLFSSVYLQNLYQSFFNEETANLDCDDSHPVIVEGEVLRRTSVKALNESDVIVSFVSKFPIHVTHVGHDEESDLWFDTREIAPGSKVLSAELRLFLGATRSSTAIFDLLKINIDMITDLDNQQSRLIDSKTFSYKQGWLMFNITGAIQEWIDHPLSNLGLYVTVFSLSTGKELDPKDIGLSDPIEDKRPFVLAFFERQSHLLHRKKRDTKSSDEVTALKPHNPYYDFTEFVSSRSCQKKSLYVSFKDLGWQDWIIAPDGYAAFFCDGECSFPLTAQMNATNHAIVQTLVHTMEPNKVPKANCAPTKLTSIMVLYFDDNSNVILKKYRNMVVKSCGCH